MIFHTSDLESVPVLLTMALAKDDETWNVEVTHGDTNTVTSGQLVDADWDNVTVQPLDPNTWQPVGDQVTIPWDEVNAVLVP